MEQRKTLGQMIAAASKARKADLVFKNARVVNVFTEELEAADVAVDGSYIVGVGAYDGVREIDLQGAILCPGFLDGHIHMESSMVSPEDFNRAVLPHGTTGVITDPHEIANVAGTAGIRYMLEATKDLKLDVFFMLPSCVPATDLDESGAQLDASLLEPFYQEERVLGLAELMNSYGTIQGDEKIINKIQSARSYGGQIDGHAPFLSGAGLNAYVMAGVRSDHECSKIEEAKEKLARGQWIMIREGTAAKNLDALMPLFDAPFYLRSMLVTDDKHPGDLIQYGHIDYIIREAVAKGADPIRAIKMGSFNTASYFGLNDRGAVAPGYLADLVVLKDLESIEVVSVYKEGCLVAGNGSCLAEKEAKKVWDSEIEDRVFDSFHMREITEDDFRRENIGELQKVIGLLPNQLTTREIIVPRQELEGADVDIVKLAVFERHHYTSHIGLGFLAGYGLKKGAVASSIAHDSHNLIIAGRNDRDMMLAGNCVRKNKGGLAVVVDGEVIGELPLPIGGLMTDASIERVETSLLAMKTELRKLGIPETVDPFMTLAFVSLPVIPKLRLNTYGLIDVERQKVIE